MSEAPATPFHKLEIPDEWKDEPTVKLGVKNREYAIAPMSGRNIAKFSAMAVELKTSNSAMAEGDVPSNIENLYRVVHYGLLRAYPQLTFDEFFDSDVRPDQLLEAFEAVSKAAGMTVRVVAAGEGQAAPSADERS